jgi:YVTN family beta-propeller protein
MGYVMKIFRCSTLAAAVASAFIALPASSADTVALTGAVADRYVHNGVVIDFTLSPGGKVKALMEGEFADVRFAITDEATGQPMRSSVPGAWLDMAQVLQGQPGAEQKSCKDKIGLYLRGVVGIRPMVDLNSYYVVLLNNDSSIAVVDPVVSMAGATSTLASLTLNAPGADWAASDRERRLYISLPRVGQVAVVDTENFKVVNSIPAGKTPVRVALQPDRRYLWVGNNASEEAQGGVTVIDTETQKTVGFIGLGAGHHEIAFSADSRHAFVTSRNAGTVTVIDVATRKPLKTLKTGAQPVSIAYSELSRAIYVADGKNGRVAVIDPEKLEVSGHVELKPGLGPLRVTPDGRFALVVNPQEDLVHVIDVATRERVQDVKIAGEPFQITFTNAYAYVRALHTERVSMINLTSLGKGRQAMVQSFAAGAQAPAAGAGPAIADSVASAASEGTVFVVNPADGTTYYYMEGMNATSSNYRVYGSSPRAVTVVDRSLKEVEPGVYTGRVRVPVAGKYDVAFMLQSPQVLHCFSAEAAENPAFAKNREPAQVEFRTTQRQYKVGDTAAIRFALTEPATGKPHAGLRDVTVLTFLAPGRMRTVLPVSDLGDGLYEARIPLSAAGAWYVHVGVPALQIGYERMGFFSLQAVASDDVKSPVAAR